MYGRTKTARHEGKADRRSVLRGDVGSALLVVLAAAAILFVTVAAVVGVVVFQQTQLTYAQGTTRATQLAQQGMEYYLSALKVDPKYWETTPTIQSPAGTADGTWTVAADVSASTLTAVGHDRLTGLLHVIRAKVRPEVFSDYTIVSGSTLKLGDSVNQDRLSITGTARGNNGIELAQAFPSLHISTPSTVGTSDAGGAIDFSKAENSLPHMFTAATYREAWGGGSASPLSFYRDPNNYERNYWGDVSNLSASSKLSSTLTSDCTEPERVGVGIDLSDSPDGQFWVRAVFPPANSGSVETTFGQFVSMARQDPTWSASNSDRQPTYVGVNGPTNAFMNTAKYLNPDGNNVVYVGGQYDAYVKGTFSRSVTIVSEHDIYIVGSVQRAVGTTATVGLVAKGNIYICGAMPSESGAGRGVQSSEWNGLVMPSTVTIQAAMMAIDGGIYMDPASIAASSTSGPAKRTKLTIQGSLAANSGLVGTNFVNTVNPEFGGFGNVEISHDSVLSDNPPPLYPQLGSGGMTVVSWDEYTTRTDPNAGLSFAPVANGYKLPTQDSGGSWVFDPSGDKQAPLTTDDVKQTYPGEAIITLTPTDSDAGIWRTYYTVSKLNADGSWTDGAPSSGTVIDIPAPAANEIATYKIEYYSVDNSGNSEPVQTSSAFKVVGPDTIPPTTKVVDVTTGDDLYGEEIPDGYPLSGDPEVAWGAFSAHFTSVDTSTGLGADRIWYSVHSGSDLVQEGFITSDWTVPIPEWPHGPRDLTFEYWGIDKAGNAGAKRTFRVTQHAKDDVAPTTLMTQSRTPGGTTVYLTATDDPAGRGVKDISYKIDDGAWVSSTSDPTTITIPAPASGTAQHTITYHARDLDLNAESDQTANLTVVRVPSGHTTPPVTTCDVQSSYIGPAVITLSPSDEIGVQDVFWKLNGGPQQSGMVVNAPAPLTGSISYTLEYWAVDFANNEETPHNVAYFVVYPEQTPPVTTAHNLDLYNGPAVIQLSAQDELGGSGIKSTYYKVDGETEFHLGTALVGPQWVTVTGDGVHTVTFYSVDNAGNPEAPKSATFRIDTTAPVTTNDNAGTYGGQAAVHLTGTDVGGSGVAATYWKASDGHSSGQQQSSDPVLLGPGTWDVTYWSVDKAGNKEAAKTFHCVVVEGADTTAPKSYDDIVPFYRTEAPTIDLFSWDVQSGVKTMHYILDGQENSLAGTFNPPWGYAISVKGTDATHTIEYWADDAAGNVETPHHVATFTVDTAMPVTTLRDNAGTEVPASTSAAYWSTQTFSLDAADSAGSGVKATYYALDGGDAQLGTHVYVPASTTGSPVTHTVEYWSIDNAGNTETRRSVRITSETSDLVAPTTTSDMKPGYLAPATVHLTAYDNYEGSGVAHTYYILDAAAGGTKQEGTVVGISGTGRHTLEYWSVDAAGNIETHHTETTSIDTTPPTSSCTASNGAWFAGSASISITATDYADGSGVASTFYRLDSGVTTSGTVPTTGLRVAGEGSHTLEFWSVDKAGNTETPHKTVTFGIDNTAPTTASDAIGAYTSGAAVVNLQPIDANGSGVLSTYYTVDGGVQQWGTKVTVPAPLAGNPVTHTITFWSVDKVGNSEAPHSATFTVAATANMTFSGMTPPELGTVTVRNPTVSVVADCDRDIVGAAATLDGVAQQLTTAYAPGATVPGHYEWDGCYSWWVPATQGPPDTTMETASFSTAGLTNGSHTVVFTFTASSRLTSVKSWTFTVGATADVKAPVTTTNASAYYSTPATITLTATDELGGMGLATTYYRADNGVVTTGTAPITTVTFSQEGSHTLEYWSVDKANNVETHHTANLIVDYTRPVTTSDAVPAATGSYKGDATITLSPIDNVGGSGIKATYYTVDGGAQQAGRTVHVVAPSNGAAVTHTVSFWSVDNAGNIETAKSVQIALRPADDVPPTTTSDVKSTYDFKSTITLTASDDAGGSGFAATGYRLDGGAVTTSTTSVTKLSTGGKGLHTLNYWSVDKAGNVEASHVATYTVVNDDFAPPTTSSDATASYAVSATISLTATDNAGSGVAATLYRVDNGAVTTGTAPLTKVTVAGPIAGSASHTLTYWSIDNVGNIETAHTVTFSITAAQYDMIFANETPASGTTTGTRTPVVSVHADAGAKNITAVSATVDGVATSTPTLTYDSTYHQQSTWVDGYWDYSGCYSYWVDGYYADTSYWTYDYTKATAKFTAKSQTDGAHTVSFTFTVAGGMQATKTWTYYVQGPDNQAPVTTSDAKPSYIGTATISLTATDLPTPPLANSGVAATYYKVDSGARQTGTTIVVPAPVYGSATHTIYFWSVDNLGNTEAQKSYTFTVDPMPDAIAPTTSSDATSSYVGTATVHLTATDNPGGWGVAHTYYQVDGGIQTSGTVITVAPPVYGVSPVHTIRFWSDDRASNVETATTATFTITAAPDNIAPTTTSNAATYYKAPGSITLTASDNAGGWGVANTFYIQDGGAQQTGTSIATGTYGKHTLEFWSVDRKGNIETSHKVTYWVDNTAPHTTRDAISSYDGTATIYLVAADEANGSGVKSTFFTVDGGAQQTGTTITVLPPTSYSLSHTITFWSVDNAGNTEVANTATFVVNAPVDHTAPTTLSNAVSTYAKPGTILLTATDDFGGWGVANTYYILDGGAQQAGTSLGTGGAGTHTLEFWSVDKAGNIESHKTVSYTVTADTTPPLTTSNAVAYYIGPATIALTASDSGWGVKATHYTVDGGAQQTGTTISIVAPASGSATHTVTFWSEDNAGNVETAHSVTMSVSGIPATMTWSGMTPAAGTTLLTSGATVSVTGDAAENVTGVTATLDGTATPLTWANPAGAWVDQGYYDYSGCYATWIPNMVYVPGDQTIATASFTAAGLPDGTHTVSFTYTVASGKTATKSWSFNVSTDVTAPTTTSDAKSVYNGAASIALTPTDNSGGSGIKATYYTVDGGAQKTGTTISVAAPASGSATHTVTFWSVDNAGNTETPKSATFVVWVGDNVAPTTTSTAQAYYPAPSTITLIATDNTGGSGVAHTYYKLDGGAQVEGTVLGTGGEGRHTLEFWSVDKLGNVETHKSITFYVDMTPPKTTSDAKPTYTGSATDYTGVAVITLTATDTPTGSGVKATYYTVDGGVQNAGTSIVINGPVSGFESHQITFWSTDNAGNAEAASTATFTVGAKPDTTPPTTTSNALSSYSVPGVIQLYATDNVGGWGLAHTYYRLDGGSQVESMTVGTGGPGSHTLEFWSTDKANNVETHKTVTYTVLASDSTPPVTTSNAADSYIGPATITLTASDDSGLMPFTYYRIDDGPQQWGTTVIVPAPIAGTVTHTVYFWSVDDAGNTETAKSATFPVTALPAAMSFSGITPGDGSTVTLRNPNVSVTAQASVNTISSATGTIDGSSKAVTLSYPTWGDFTKAVATFQTASLTNSVHTATMTFTDSTGAQCTKTWTFTVNAAPDVTPPVTTEDTIISGGTATVRLTAADEGGTGVAATYYKLDNGVQFTGTPPLTTVPVGAGVHTIEYWSVDLAGNTETHQSASFTIDITPPTTTTNARTTYTGTATLTLNPSDNVGGSGVKATYYKVDSGAVSTGTIVAVAPPQSADPATHTVYFWSVDNAGNIEATKSATFTSWAPSDYTPPTTTSNAVSTYKPGDVITLVATDNSNGWGVAHTYYQLDGGPQTEGTSVPVGAVGAHTLSFWSVDNAGNAESPHNTVMYNVISDTTPPATTSDAAATYALPNVITLTATDSGGWGVAHTYYKLDGGAQTEGTAVSTGGAGSHSLEFWSVDLAGNVETHHTVTYTVTADDRIAPSTGSDVQTSYYGPGVIRLTPVDNSGGSGVAHTYYKLDGGAQTESTIVGVSGAGSHSLVFWSVDLAGNVETAHTVTFTIYAADITAPVTTSNAQSSYNGTATVILTSTDTGGSGVNATYYRIDGGAQQTGTTVVIAPPASGTASHTITFWSVDKVGNVETGKTATFNVVSVADTAAPLTTSNAAATYTGSATIVLTPSDTGGSGVSATYYRIDGGAQQTGTTVVIAPPATGSASHTVTYWSVDGAGNTEATKSFTTTVSAVVVNTTATLSFHWNHTGYAEADLHVEDASGQTVASSGRLSDDYGGDLSWDVNVPAGQNYYLVCDYYYDGDTADTGGGYGHWSYELVSDNPLQAGDTVVWNY